MALVLKNSAMNLPTDLDKYETLATLMKMLPQLFLESDQETIRTDYSEFIDQYADECDIDNPDELREEASRIKTVGDFIQVDTSNAVNTLNESVQQIEAEEVSSSWDEDDDQYAGGGFERCPDAELDSMFKTLEN